MDGITAGSGSWIRSKATARVAACSARWLVGGKQHTDQLAEGRIEPSATCALRIEAAQHTLKNWPSDASSRLSCLLFFPSTEQRRGGKAREGAKSGWHGRLLAKAKERALRVVCEATFLVEVAERPSRTRTQVQGASVAMCRAPIRACALGCSARKPVTLRLSLRASFSLSRAWPRLPTSEARIATLALRVHHPFNAPAATAAKGAGCSSGRGFALPPPSSPSSSLPSSRSSPVCLLLSPHLLHLTRSVASAQSTPCPVGVLGCK